MYYRNPDERLRRLEREYAVNGGEELRSRINVQRLRSGMKLLPPTYRLFEFGPENLWQMQSPLAGIMVSSAGSPHDGWYGVSHGAWHTDGDDDSFIDLGDHSASSPPTQLEVIKAHLEVLVAVETRGLSGITKSRWGDFKEGHEVDISIYDLSESPIRHILQCGVCGNVGSIYCNEHDMTVCRDCGTNCEDECSEVECPQCAPKCDVCKQPACSYHIRECDCGDEACTNAGTHCWDFCEACGARMCMDHLTPAPEGGFNCLGPCLNL
jgi:hypothetical protein